MIGALFFLGLWWTIQKSVSEKRPAIFFMCSLLARMSFALCGIYLLSKGDLKRLVLCTAGFFIGRRIATQFTRGALQSCEPASGATHAS